MSPHITGAGGGGRKACRPAFIWGRSAFMNAIYTLIVGCRTTDLFLFAGGRTAPLAHGKSHQLQNRDTQVAPAR
jgi:hypothetical protein